MNCIKLEKARSVYEKGGNVTEFLRSEFGESDNTREIIEIAYDLQAGSYINHVTNDPQKARLYANELSSFITPYLTGCSNLLDVGTGELTTLSLMLREIDNPPNEIWAFDISWSRLAKGKVFWNNTVKNPGINLHPFVADIKKIPLATKSIDVVTSSHALEPNGRNLACLLLELFRVCKKKLVLFEPSYELNSNEGKERMNRLGYIRGIEESVDLLGGKVQDIQLIKNTNNPLNPTACYVIEPPSADINRYHGNATITNAKFTVPGTNYQLTPRKNFLVSAGTGLVFPILENIPILKEEASIIATSLFD